VDNTVTSHNNDIKNDQLNVQNEDKEEVLEYNIQKLTQESEPNVNYNQEIQQDQEQQGVGSEEGGAEGSPNEVSNYVEASVENNVENSEPSHMMATNT
jgi:hypothetical protein